MNRRQFITSSSAVLATSLLPSCSKDKPVLYVFTWADYLSENAASAFEKEHNCTLKIDTFDSNEAMIAKLESGATGYDVIVPSSYAVKELEAKGLLQPLDHAKLPNLKNIDQGYLGQALDQKMNISVPYMMAPTCVAYLKSKIEGAQPSWNLFSRSEIKGRATMLDDMREVLGAALLSLGYSLNSTDETELSAAAELAIQWKANLAKYESEQYKAGIASGEFHLVHGYAGELLAVSDENSDIQVLIPEEGAPFSCDDLCIPKAAKNTELAHAFINHLCDAEIAAENMQWICYRAPNSAAYSMLPEDFRSSEILFPPDELFKKCSPISYLGEKLQVWVSTWEKVKNA